MRLRRAPSQNSTNPRDQMNCPKCLGKTRVTNTTLHPSGRRIRRFRHCDDCGHNFRTTQHSEKLDDDGFFWRYDHIHSVKKSGEGSSSAILTNRDVMRLRIRYQAGGVTFVELAKGTGLSANCIRDAIKGKTWKHLSGAVK